MHGGREIRNFSNAIAISEMTVTLRNENMYYYGKLFLKIRLILLKGSQKIKSNVRDY